MSTNSKQRTTIVLETDFNLRLRCCEHSETGVFILYMIAKSVTPLAVVTLCLLKVRKNPMVKQCLVLLFIASLSLCV